MNIKAEITCWTPIPYRGSYYIHGLWVGTGKKKDSSRLVGMAAPNVVVTHSGSHYKLKVRTTDERKHLTMLQKHFGLAS